MKGFVLSKLLLLQRVISDDNAANNGGSFLMRFGLDGPKRSTKIGKLIPWEACSSVKGGKEYRGLPLGACRAFNRERVRQGTTAKTLIAKLSALKQRGFPNLSHPFYRRICPVTTGFNSAQNGKDEDSDVTVL